MKFLTVKIKVIMLVVIALGLALAVVVNFTGICRLEGVVLDGREVDNWQKKYPLEAGHSVFKQPLDELADKLLAGKNIGQVEIDYVLPDRLSITTNNFEPVCFAVDKDNGRLYGLDEKGRVLRLDKKISDWEHPFLTSVTVKKLFAECDDYRVGLVVAQLEDLRRRHLDLYRLVDEIDFEAAHFLMVTVSGFPFRLKVTAEAFLEQFNVFVRFMESYEAGLDSTSVVDLRFEDMIITVRENS
ncbi:MAG: hypothetical protein PHN52_07540 [candidate division Zixibacteria bacterium]|nr:hypothetical protein [candidate division Zixibacteria bacterium]